MKTRLLLALLCLPAAVQASPSRTVSFRTRDGWAIRAAYISPKKGRPIAVLVHGVAAGKGEWLPLTAELEKLGIGSLAIDLRGHGESQDGPTGKTDFKGFDSVGEWPKARQDIEAAAAFLKNRGISSKRIGYIGASIGANLVSQAKPGPHWLVLLSPGADYRGVPLALSTAHIPVLVAASPADGYAFSTVEAYAQQSPGATLLQAASGHGAQMFSDPEFLKSLLGWIDNKSR